MKLNVSPDLRLPLDAVTSTFAILARKRVGKTYLASVLAEEMIKAKLPLVVFDPTGAWWGLRASADGKRAGLPVVIIGGNHADVPLEPEAGKVIADLVVDQPGWYILDFSLTASDAEQVRFGAEFLSRLYRRKGDERFRDPVMIIVDESDVWAPQQPGSPHEIQSLHHLKTAVRRGGLRGIGVTMITQRPAELSKSVLTQAEALMVLQITAPQDQDAVDSWIKRNGTQAQRAELMGSLASLQKGDAWYWHPTEGAFRRFRARERETFNSSATPEVGKSRKEPKVLAPVDLEALRGKIAATIQKAESEDPRRLRERIAVLERDLRASVAKAPPSPPAAKPTRVEVPVIKEGQILRLQSLATKLYRAGEIAQGAAVGIREAVNRAQDVRPPKPVGLVTTTIRTPEQVSRFREAVNRDAIKPDGKAIKAGARRMLAALATFYPNPIGRLDLGVLSGVGANGGTFSSYLSSLITAGLVGERGNGVELMSPPKSQPAPQRTEEIVQAHRSRLKAGAARMLALCVEAYPEGILRGKLGEEAGVSSGGGTFSSYLSQLRTKGLVTEERGTVRAAEVLFWGGR